MRNTVILTAMPARNLPNRDLAIHACALRMNAERLESLASAGGPAYVAIATDAHAERMLASALETMLRASLMSAIGR